MNAVEIEQAITDLAEQPFDSAEFPYAFLEAFGNKATTIKRLRAGASNKSDLGGVLQTSNIHILTCDIGRVTQTLAALKASPATAKAKAKFILATDGADFEAEDLTSGETVACAFKDFPDHFGFFLPLAGISTVRQISENAFDIRATSRLNRLYVELLKDNPEWGSAERRHDMNKLMARLIFCFFAEDTDIFVGRGRFTETVAQMSAKDSSNTHEVIATLFRAMNTKREDRAAAKIPRWAEDFPYVNGQLFSGGDEVPRFSKIARSYLLHVGGLDWTKINPDIFGSMIQAVAEDEERGELGMHYTSVPNILKGLNPLFLDDLREKLEEAGDNARMLLNLRKRIAKIRVFDPACGSGNFLVIAYKEMRAIEAEINRRRGEPDRASEIPVTNFRGIELRDFPAEIARLALVIAEYQCDVLYRGQKLALAEFLPLRNENWITCGNALRLDWLSICPPTGTGVKMQADDLFGSPLDQSEIDFENEGGETYICGNPPYKGSQTQTKEQKADLASVFDPCGISSKQIDYVGGWFMKAAAYAQATPTDSAFVSTNSICQGRIVPILWPEIFKRGSHIRFAHTSFKWTNLAAHNAGVTVAIVGLSTDSSKKRQLYDLDRDGETTVREATNITPYLTVGENVVVEGQRKSVSGLPDMSFGNMPVDGGNLLLSADDAASLGLSKQDAETFLRRIYGSAEFIRGVVRKCLWIPDEKLPQALQIASIRARIDGVREMRLKSRDAGTNEMASRAHQFREMYHGEKHTLILPGVSSEGREYLPVGLIDNHSVVSNLAFALYDAPLWNLALIASRLHLVWIATVCGKLKTDFRYSNTLGWNTFPVPTLTEKNKADLTRCAEDILLAREHHFPATIADLYDPENMPADLRAAHDRNDEVLERIYIGRRFKNDTERLEKLFDLYTKMTASAAPAKGKKRKAGANA
ncbi:TPA: class I SAM-dependent DNA methyltransferase [Pseudomonas aeruginosa]|uniref:class I SAM-dependent DNA methyltransferase n=1 Tax=Pseudomonas aeruginosa TaxID=287 RepID=UPI0011B50434|nr:DNA methyltransferase [Pseudomonas aeruginosa]MBH9517064.1 class I SAM-dependent DNA methyltransferase [Pseudomonas aeruginosa]MBV6181894.1 class I SAM-dependent DNA methyltransferase [Pseudomonas aeruginosa]TWV93498.1 class I SAM-dependent DNA methyltransferase [Pseudomonas aeruginosa]HCF0703766.1 class I SAM-dependent DNA methyltransferase [Pseudomonas aeruginosa]HEJ1143851.1 class I SAM-dependent DNA methyltransferase [Pseudomonas aeruginosa]